MVVKMVTTKKMFRSFCMDVIAVLIEAVFEATCFPQCIVYYKGDIENHVLDNIESSAS